MSYLTMGMQIMQGVETMKAAKQEASAQKKQSALAVQESERTAGIAEEENKRNLHRQGLQFLKSGVRLEGTPLSVLAEGKERGAETVESIRGAGRAQGSLLRARSHITERGGRAALYGGIGKAAQTYANMEGIPDKGKTTS